jgi:hypothetical protein
MRTALGVLPKVFGFGGSGSEQLVIIEHEVAGGI